MFAQGYTILCCLLGQNTLKYQSTRSPEGHGAPNTVTSTGCSPQHQLHVCLSLKLLAASQAKVHIPTPSKPCSGTWKKWLRYTLAEGSSSAKSTPLNHCHRVSDGDARTGAVHHSHPVENAAPGLLPLSNEYRESPTVFRLKLFRWRLRTIPSG